MGADQLDNNSARHLQAAQAVQRIPNTPPPYTVQPSRAGDRWAQGAKGACDSDGTPSEIADHARASAFACGQRQRRRKSNG